MQWKSKKLMKNNKKLKKWYKKIDKINNLDSIVEESNMSNIKIKENHNKRGKNGNNYWISI